MTELSMRRARTAELGSQRSFRSWYDQAWKLLALPLIIFFLLPVAAIFLRLTPEAILTSLQSGMVLQAVQLSLFTSLCTVALTIVLGTPLAYLVYRRRSRFSRLVDTLIDLPTVLPPAAAGVALLIAFGRQGLVGGVLADLGISLPFTTAAVILAQTFIAAPLYIKSASLGFGSVDCEIKKAAALDGASRWQVVRYIVLPMSWMSLVSGAIMTWARALGEFGATMIFAGNLAGRTQTMPLAIYLGFELDLEVALTLSAILILISFISLLVLKWFLHTNDTSLELEDR